MQNKKIVFIIPCYNESQRLQGDEFVNFARECKLDIDFCFVNDGSTDNTLDLLKSIAERLPQKLKVYNLEKNVGKAEAIRQAIIKFCIDCEYIGFIDADLSAPLSEILPLTELIISQNLEIVAGARVKLIGKVIIRSTIRHYFGRVFATYQDSLLKLGNYDTQCGLKIFDSKLAAQLFSEKFTSNWFFDIELFVRARKLLGNDGYTTKVVEMPLNEWKEVKGSKLKLTDFLKAPFEVLKIYRKYT